MNESMSETKFIFHTQVPSENPMQNIEKCAAMKQIQAICFVMDDLRLFLDTHPFETQAFHKFEEARSKRCELINDYETKYGPIEAYHVNLDNQWTWVDNPWPWEGI